MSGVNLQDTFLEQAKNNNYVVMVHLVGKVKLVGVVKDFDKFSVTINSYGQDQLIYKQAISTIVLPRGRTTRLMIQKPGDAAGGDTHHSGDGPRNYERRDFRPRPPRDHQDSRDPHDSHDSRERRGGGSFGSDSGGSFGPKS